MCLPVVGHDIRGKDEAGTRRPARPRLDADDAALPDQSVDVENMAGNRQRRLRLGDDLRKHRVFQCRLRQRDQVLR